MKLRIIIALATAIGSIPPAFAGGSSSGGPPAGLFVAHCVSAGSPVDIKGSVTSFLFDPPSAGEADVNFGDVCHPAWRKFGIEPLYVNGILTQLNFTHGKTRILLDTSVLGTAMPLFNIHATLNSDQGNEIQLSCNVYNPSMSNEVVNGNCRIGMALISCPDPKKTICVGGLW
jgi:hypothetical protein